MVETRIPPRFRNSNEALNWLIFINGGITVKDAPLAAANRRLLVDCITLDPLWGDVMQAFKTAPGSIKYHHTGTGGLIVHTAEVAYHCRVMVTALFGRNIITYPLINLDAELFTAALWHDVGKIYLYRQEDLTKWGYTEGGKEVGHIAYSLMLWFNAATQAEVDREQIHRISHLIASHHGRKDWGAIAEPANIWAYILHWADIASSQFQGSNNG